MCYEWRNNMVVMVHNLAAAPFEMHLKLRNKDLADQALVYLLSEDHSLPSRSGMHRVVMEPYGYRWYRVGGLDYLLKRTEY